jgi:hypothetical protein
MSVAIRSEPYHPTVARPIRQTFTDFASHANAICSEFLDRVHSLRSSGKPAAIVFQQTIGMAESVMSRLSSLKPPAKQAVGYARLLAMTRADLAGAVTLLADLQANRRDQAIQLLKQQKPTGWSEYYLARGLGLYGCTTVSAIEQSPTR